MRRTRRQRTGPAYDQSMSSRGASLAGSLSDLPYPRADDRQGVGPDGVAANRPTARVESEVGSRSRAEGRTVGRYGVGWHESVPVVGDRILDKKRVRRRSAPDPLPCNRDRPVPGYGRRIGYCCAAIPRSTAASLAMRSASPPSSPDSIWTTSASISAARLFSVIAPAFVSSAL